MLEWIIFLLGSLGFFILSLRSLLKPLSHGFPRFFAFEAILGLVVLNSRSWFIRPLSLPQLVSWALLIDSVFLAIHAIWTLRRFGKTDRTIQDASRIAFEKTTHLVTIGPYQFIRHLMYAALLCFGWGAFLKQVSLASGLLLILACLALFTTAYFEEQENLRIFGDEYSQYMRTTKRFIPLLF